MVSLTGDDEPDDPWSRGVYAYGRMCVSCHRDEMTGDEDAPALVGPGSLPEQPPKGSGRQMPLRTGGDLLDYVRASMPPLEAGNLDDETSRIIVYTILKERGVAVPATADEAALRALPLRP